MSPPGLPEVPEVPDPPEAPDVPEAIDPDVDLHVPAQRAETAGGHKWPVLAAISAGGVAGTLARYAATVLWPAAEGSFPWAVFWVNVLGCSLIGVFMVLVSEGGRGRIRWCGRSSGWGCSAGSRPSPRTHWTSRTCWSVRRRTRRWGTRPGR